MGQGRVHLFVSGLVQGVYFRAYAREVARQHGLCGWVRNCSDGRVEAVVEGEDGAVRSFITWCHHGPPSAQVTDVQVTWEPCGGEFHAFTIRV